MDRVLFSVPMLGDVLFVVAMAVLRFSDGPRRLAPRVRLAGGLLSMGTFSLLFVTARRVAAR